MTPLLRKAQPGPPSTLVAEETIFDPNDVVGKGRLVEDVAEGFAELVVLVVGYADHPILHGKGIVVVDSGFVSADFDRPIGQVLAVE